MAAEVSTDDTVSRSLIQVLDPDVLSCIFERCLPSDRDPLLSETRAPLVLSRVCALWHDVISNSPALWDSIYTIVGTVTDDDDDVSNELHVVEHWLARSGVRPLRIHVIQDPGVPVEHGRLNAGQRWNFWPFQRLLKESSRWQSLTMSPQLAVSSGVLDLQTREAFPMLRELAWVETAGSGDLPLHPIFNFCHHLAPNLGLATLPALAKNLLDDASSWRSLRRVHLFWDTKRFAYANLLRFLRECTELEGCSIALSPSQDTLEVPDRPPLQISCKRLSFLRVRGGRLSVGEFTHWVLSNLLAPALVSVQLSFISNSPYWYDNIAGFKMYSVLSPSLTTLCIQPIHSHHPAIIQLFQSLVGLRRLQIRAGQWSGSPERFAFLGMSVNADVLSALTKGCPRLAYVDLDFIDRVAPQAVLEFLRARPNLRVARLVFLHHRMSAFKEIFLDFIQNRDMGTVKPIFVQLDLTAYLGDVSGSDFRFSDPHTPPTDSFPDLDHSPCGYFEYDWATFIWKLRDQSQLIQPGGLAERFWGPTDLVRVEDSIRH